MDQTGNDNRYNDNYLFYGTKDEMVNFKKYLPEYNSGASDREDA